MQHRSKLLNFPLFVLFTLLSSNINAQQKLGDNLGTHTAAQELQMQGFSILNTSGIAAGLPGLSNGSVGVEFGSGKAIKVTNVANSDEIINPLNGMIIYRTADNTFLFYQEGIWVPLLATVAGSPMVDLITAQSINGLKTFISPNGILATSALNSGTIPTEGAGTRMMWYPKKASFRAGNVTGTHWDDTNTGVYSVALGYNTTASGENSTALGSSVSTNVMAGSFIVGDRNVATGNAGIATAPDQYTSRFKNGYRFLVAPNGGTGLIIDTAGVANYVQDNSAKFTGRSLVTKDFMVNYLIANNGATGATLAGAGAGATAIGESTSAAGANSVAMGQATTASGANSTAMGQATTSSGANSVALGQDVTASGANSTAIGQHITTAGANASAMGVSLVGSGARSTAFGQFNVASGANSTAMGTNVSTNAMAGSFILGDFTVPTVDAGISTVPNQFTTRFTGGYRFLTSADGVIGLNILPTGVISYQGDYSAAYTDRSLVDKGYVTSVLNGGAGITSVTNATAAITLSQADNGKTLITTSATAVTLTVPSTLTSDFTCKIIQYGAGGVTFLAGAGVVINNRSGFVKTAGRYAVANLTAISTTSFVSSGDMQ